MPSSHSQTQKLSIKNAYTDLIQTLYKLYTNPLYADGPPHIRDHSLLLPSRANYKVDCYDPGAAYANLDGSYPAAGGNALGGAGPSQICKTTVLARATTLSDVGLKWLVRNRVSKVVSRELING